jgi:glycosyltransferase involved in cell wall biosynthesis
MRRCSNCEKYGGNIMTHKDLKKKGVYLIYEPNYALGEQGHGINKKINQQLSLFNQFHDFQLINIFDYMNESKIKLIKLISWLLNNQIKNLNIKNVDYIYIRKPIPLQKSFLELLKAIRKNNPKVKIVMEIPTYPYDDEFTTFRTKILLSVDKLFRKKVKNIIDKISTYSEHKTIFSLPAIQVFNGIDCNTVPLVKTTKVKDEIRLIAVAQFATWHGYDRLIKGVANYYLTKTHQQPNLYVDMVGDGSVLEEYKTLVKELNLEKYIVFYGKCHGDKLTQIFDQADIAIGSLGSHRINIFISSQLKSREYLARGLPIVSSTKIDIIPEGFPYCLYVPENESDVDIQVLINFYCDLGNDYEKTKVEIRKFAESYCSMEYGMRSVIEYFKES